MSEQIHAIRSDTLIRNHHCPESQSAVVAALQLSEIGASNHSHNVGEDLREILHRLTKLEQASKPDQVRGAAVLSQDVLTCQSRDMYDMQSRTNKTRILRWSHWASEAPEVREQPRMVTGPLKSLLVRKYSLPVLKD